MEKSIERFGIAIGTVWVVMVLVAVIFNSRLTPPAFWLGLTLHPFGEKFTPLQLLTYSLVHNIYIHLISNLIRLYCIVYLAKKFLSLAGFIRLFSLGSIFGGLGWLLYTFLTNKESNGPTFGSGSALIAVIAAMAILNPHKDFWSDSLNRRRLILFILISFFNLLYQETMELSVQIFFGYIAALISGSLYGFIERVLQRSK